MSATTPPPAAERPWRRTLVRIALGAFALRAAGAFGQGLPFGYYPDETNAIWHALYFGAMGTADPGWFNKPALFYYLLFGVCGATYVGGRVLGAWGDVEAFGAYAAENYAPFLVGGRLLNAAFGALTVWAAYLLGKRVQGRALGLVAAAALALVPGHLASSRLVKEDVPCALLMTAATLCLVDVARRARAKDYLRAGGFAGLAMAVKYYAPALAVPGAFAHVFRRFDARAGRGRFFGAACVAGAAAAFVAGFFVGSPYNFLNPNWMHGHVASAVERVRSLGTRGLVEGVLGALVAAAVAWWFMRRARRRTGPSGGGGAGVAGVLVAAAALAGVAVGAAPQIGAAYGRMTDTGGTFTLADRLAYAFRSLTVGVADEAGVRLGGLGTALSVLAAAGVVVALARRTRADGVLLASAGAQILFAAAASRQLPEPRHLIGVYPIAAAWIADACLLAAAVARRAIGRRGLPGAGAGLAALALAAAAPTRDPVGLGGSLVGLHVDVLAETFARDTRSEAVRFVEMHLPAGATIMNVHEALPLRMGTARAEFMRDKVRGLVPADERNHRRGLGRLWTLRAAAAASGARPTFDAFVLESQWQTEDEDPAKRERARAGFGGYWPVEPAAGPADVPPVERYRRVPWTGVAEADRALRGTWPAASDLLAGTKLDWLVATSTSYDNYLKASKRRAFPIHAAFFDDLKAHYDCLEWSPGPGVVGPRLRLYDLRRRVEGRPPRVVACGAESP